MDLRGYGRSTGPPEMSRPASENPPVVGSATAVQDRDGRELIRQRRNLPRLVHMGWSWDSPRNYTRADRDRPCGWTPVTTAVRSRLSVPRDRWLCGCAQTRRGEPLSIRPSAASSRFGSCGSRIPVGERRMANQVTFVGVPAERTQRPGLVGAQWLGALARAPAIVLAEPAGTRLRAFNRHRTSSEDGETTEASRR